MENQKLQNMVKFSFPQITTFLNNKGIEKKQIERTNFTNPQLASFEMR